MSDNKIDGPAGAVADVAGLNSGEDSGALDAGTAPDQETADVAVADDAGQIHCYPAQPNQGRRRRDVDRGNARPHEPHRRRLINGRGAPRRIEKHDRGRISADAAPVVFGRCRGWIRTNGLRVMSPTSCHCSTLRRNGMRSGESNPGRGLSSHGVAPTVLSMLRRFTTVFGMGTGGSTARYHQGYVALLSCALNKRRTT